MSTVMNVVGALGLALLFVTCIVANIANEVREENPKLYAGAKRVMAWMLPPLTICLVAMVLWVAVGLFGWI